MPKRNVQIAIVTLNGKAWHIPFLHDLPAKSKECVEEMIGSGVVWSSGEWDSADDDASEPVPGLDPPFMGIRVDD